MGDMERKNVLVVFMIFTIASFGLSSNTAYAAVDPECSMFAGWNFLPTPPTAPDNSGSEPCPDATGPLSPPARAATLSCGPIDLEISVCTAALPNFDDDLSEKFIEIHVEYDQSLHELIFGRSFPFTTTSTVATDATDGPVVCTQTSAVSTGTGFFDITITCLPNPDSEIITVRLPGPVTFISVEFFTHSFDDIAIGGTYIPIDNTALLLAGVQSISMWMIPVVVAGIGIGVFVIKRRN